MTGRAWILAPNVVVRIVVGLFAYAVVAEAIDFHLIGLRTAGTRVLEHRLMECMLLWLVVCSIVGWTKFFRNRHPEYESTIRPILLIPLAMSLWLAAINGFDAYSRYLSRINSKPPVPPSGYFWIDVGLPVMSVANPLLMWVVSAFLLGVQAKVWRAPVKVGLCPICNYEHQGNESGICPECGSEVVRDPTIPRAYYKRRFWWTPELAQFRDAKSRQEAMKQAHRECEGSMATWIAIVLCVVGLACMTPVADVYLGQWKFPVMAITAIASLAINLVWLPHATRRSLRRQLSVRPGSPESAGSTDPSR